MYRQSSVHQSAAFDATNRHGSGLLDAQCEQENVALRVESLGKRYGASEAVAGVSFNVRHGEVFGLLGLNGAGKTTLISMLAGQRRPSSGDAILLDRSVRDEPRLIRRLIGVASQEVALYPLL